MKPAPAARSGVLTGLTLALVLAVVASTVVGGRSAGAALDTAALQSLRADLATAAATSADLYQRSGGLLVRLAEREPTDAEVRSNTVAAIRTVTQHSSRLAERSRQLSDALDPLPVGIPGTEEQLDDALSRYLAEDKVYRRQADQLQAQIDAAKAAESLDEFVIELAAFAGSAGAYDEAAQTFAAVLRDLEDVLVERERDRNGVRLSVYGFADNQKAPPSGYGLYTHVLFGTKSDRNAVLLHDLLEEPIAALFADQQAATNLFVIPVSSSLKAKLTIQTSAAPHSEIASRDVYNYEFSKKILGQICLNSNESMPDFCSRNWQGPFLLSHTRYLSDPAKVAHPYLLVDLSNIEKEAFSEFVRAVKQQVMLPDFTSREKIDTFHLQLLDMIFKAAETLGNLKERVRDILAVVKQG